jgi:hypothetical protein
LIFLGSNILAKGIPDIERFVICIEVLEQPSNDLYLQLYINEIGDFL